MSSRRGSQTVGIGQVTQNNEDRTTEVLLCKLPPKERNPGDFTLLCTIVGVCLVTYLGWMELAREFRTHLGEFLAIPSSLIKVADMTKKAPLWVVENILVGIDKFLFPSDFVIINRTPNETIILGRPFLATIYAKIHLFNKELSLGVDMEKALLKSWVIDCIEEALDPIKDPIKRSFDDYKWVFDLEIEQLADVYELGIRKKGHILDMIWENALKEGDDEMRKIFNNRGGNPILKKRRTPNVAKRHEAN
ncbi:putative reverse transcriptase domain-containing protein [Tanacetum coccineum]